MLRLAPDTDLSVRETVVQAGVAGQGYPTPNFHASDDAHDEHRAWSVMDFAAGQPLLAGLNGLHALASLPTATNASCSTGPPPGSPTPPTTSRSPDCCSPTRHSLQACRVLLELAGWRAAGTTDLHRGHPWLAIEPTLRPLLDA